MKYIIALCFITGLVLAGSDGAYFPWINFAGLLIFGLVPVLAGRCDDL